MEKEMTDKTSEKTCCFFGHSEIYSNGIKLKPILLENIEHLIIKGFTKFLFGGYGCFDELCFQTVNNLKAKYTYIKTIYVQAYYIPHDYRMKLFSEKYNELLFPDIWDKPKKFAIVYRNQKMIDMSDFCLFYVNRFYGGAYQAFQYAKRKYKDFCNLGSLEIQL